MKRISTSTILLVSVTAGTACWLIFGSILKRTVKIQVKNLTAGMISYDSDISIELTRLLMDMITS